WRATARRSGRTAARRAGAIRERPWAGAARPARSVGGPRQVVASRSSYRRRQEPHGRLPPVSHPSLGLPPRDMSAGDTTAAAALRSGGPRLRARALAAALELNPTMKDRHAEVVLQALLADLEAFHDRLVVAVSSADPHAMAT